MNTVKPVYSGHAIQRTPGYSGHFFLEPANFWSNSHKKTSIQRTHLQRTYAIVDTFFQSRMNISPLNHLFITETQSFRKKISTRKMNFSEFLVFLSMYLLFLLILSFLFSLHSQSLPKSLFYSKTTKNIRKVTQNLSNVSFITQN